MPFWGYWALGWDFWVFLETDNARIFINLDDAKLVRFFNWKWQTGDTGICLVFARGMHHVVDIHHKNMVATKDQHLFWISIFDQVHILINGVSGATIPVFAGALLSGHRGHKV